MILHIEYLNFEEKTPQLEWEGDNHENVLYNPQSAEFRPSLTQTHREQTGHWACRVDGKFYISSNIGGKI